MANGSVKLFFYSLVGFAAGFALFIHGFIWFRQKRAIENTPTSKIRSLAMGLVEIFGEAISLKGKLLNGPFSGKPCVYYKYLIEEHRSSGKSSRWVAIGSGCSNENFFLKDETGWVLVDPKGSEVDLRSDFVFNSGVGKDPSGAIISFLKSHNLSFEGFLGVNRTMRYTEWIICPKDSIYIMGTAGDNPFVAEGASAKNTADIMIQKGENKSFFYISDKQEKAILKKLMWKTIGGLFGGSALMLACLTVIFIYLGIL